jgi:hypothetical protein
MRGLAFVGVQFGGARLPKDLNAQAKRLARRRSFVRDAEPSADLSDVARAGRTSPARLPLAKSEPRRWVCHHLMIPSARVYFYRSIDAMPNARLGVRMGVANEGVSKALIPQGRPLTLRHFPLAAGSRLSLCLQPSGQTLLGHRLEAGMCRNGSEPRPPDGGIRRLWQRPWAP